MEGLKRLLEVEKNVEIETIRLKRMKWLYLLVGSASMFFALYQIWGHFYEMAFLTAVLSAGLLAGWLYLVKTSKTVLASGVLAAVLLTVFSVCIREGNWNGIWWALWIPVFAMNAMKMGWGSALSIAGGIFLTIDIVFIRKNIETPVPAGEGPGLLVLFLFLYWGITAAAVLLRLDLLCLQSRYLDNKEKTEEAVSRERKKVEDLTLQSILAIANTVDAKDEYTKQHSARVAEYSAVVAGRLGWPEKRIQNLYHMALLHDIGKIGVPDSILNKPAALTKDEYELMKNHVVVGAEILKEITTIEHVAEGARYHHERYDGKGYCEGLKGEAIPIEARIIGIADALDAMTSDRSYRKRLDLDYVKKEIERGKGRQFDPKLAQIMLELLEDETFVGCYLNDKLRNSALGELEAQESEACAALELEKTRLDPVSGVPDRYAAKIAVDRYLKDKRNQGALFVLDIDNFTIVNDRKGHVAGDEILRQFALFLMENTKEGDLVCRMGSDEFIIFYQEEIRKSELGRKAETIIEKGCRRAESLGVPGEVTVSIGIAVSPEAGADFDTLYMNAGKSLYYVKHNKRGGYQFYEAQRHVKDVKESIAVDIDQLAGMIGEIQNESGAYHVEYEGFRKIYHFLKRNLSITNQEIQIILFTAADREGNTPDGAALMRAVSCLQTVIRRSLRRGDLTTGFSNSQVVVLLMGTAEENGKVVAERILTQYYRLREDSEIEIHYAVRSFINS